MNRETTALKLTCLLGPLAAAFLSLHTWGEPLRAEADRLWMGRVYKEHDWGGLEFSVRRGTHVHKPAGDMLLSFLDTTLKEYGAAWNLKDPRNAEPRFRIVLLETEAHLKPHGLRPSSAADHSGGRFLSDRREIVMVIGAGAQHREADSRVLRHQMTHLLLHRSAPDADWSPWLEEGLAEYLQDEAAGNRPTVEIRPSLDRLLSATRKELRAASAEDLRQGARLLVAFLLDRHLDRFSSYVREDRSPGPAAPDVFSRRIGPPREVEQEWDAWTRLSK